MLRTWHNCEYSRGPDMPHHHARIACHASMTYHSARCARARAAPCAALSCGRVHKRGVVSALALLAEAHRLQQANGALGWSELLLEGLGAPADASVLVLGWVLDGILDDGEERLGRELEDGRVLVEKQNTARASSSAAVAANEAAGGGGCGGCDDLGGITAEEKASGVRVERALSALGIYLVPRFPAT